MSPLPSPRRKRSRSRILPTSLLFCAAVAVSWGAVAAEPGPAASRNAPFIEVRLALSDSASALLAQRRLKRYLSIELEDAGHLAAQGQGPLSDHVAYVWIDLPESGKVLIQTRVGRGAVAMRTFPLRDGLRADVAARLVAIATSEMVRSQAGPVRARKPKAHKPPTPERVELATRDNPAVLLAGKADAAWLPSLGGVLGGSALEVAFRFDKVRPFMAGSWLVGDSEGGPTRWVGMGLGADRSFWLSPSFRFDLGLAAHAATVHLRDGVFLDDGGRDAWTARATGRLQAEHILRGPVWVGLSLEPGLLLRSAPFEAPGGAASLEGFYLGMGIALQFEHRLKGVAFSPVRW